ncbi:MAG: hypothetical protein K0R54_196 [Clostridiaceae bacterium]|jgi:exodeoxyribonuclease V alpha subunit|nr:hypothetical protein [Clostridiaceae bacterium]
MFNNGFSKFPCDDFDKRDKSNILDTHTLNTKVTKTIIPTFEITYMESSGFGAYIVEDENENTFSVKGTFISELIIGQTYSVEGTICVYKGERQINVSTIRNVKPVNKKGIIAYLQTLRGLKSKASLIYDKFGDKSIQILIDNPMLVSETVTGIGKKSVTKWKEQLDKMKESQYTISSLLGYGLSPKQAKKLYDKYGDEIVSRIEQNPYFLSSEVKGYGFEKCDRIARNVGFNPKSEFRIQEGIIHVLNEASSSGHCFLPQEELISRAINLLKISLTVQEMNGFASEKIGQTEFDYEIGTYKYPVNYNEMRSSLDMYRREKNNREKEKHRHTVISFLGEEILDQLIEVQCQRRIVIDKDKVYLKQLFIEEREVAERVCCLAVEKPFKISIELESELDKFIKENNITLEDMQRKAVIEFSKNNGGFFILNGSAGCGKTFTLKIILEMLKRQYSNMNKPFRVKVLAPTGKASKVATKATGRICTTVHRGLGYNPQIGFEYNEDNPLEADCVVVDESSMLDISLAKSLLVAISNGTKVIFMGDTKQLPSVGPGNVLNDLINSNVVKVITLNVVKRQGELSGIIKNANRIINNEVIENCENTKDAYVIFRRTVEGTQKAIIDSIKRILSMDGFTLDDIQLLCPQKNGQIGTWYMNYLLQKEFNKSEEGLAVVNKNFQVTSYDKAPEMITLYFKTGDKVIHIKNNYDMEWYTKGLYGGYILEKEMVGITNGECGTIEEIVKVRIDGETTTRIIVKYEDKYVFYDDGYDELDHSYALTIHKSQGSQWKAIIMPIMKQNYIMLDNNLFYTGYTRAELFEVTIGQIEAMTYAVKTHKTRDRFTALTDRICELVA